ncbi:hypothetical protein JZ751_023572 [Albula glossodonta]|uniref:Alpha-1,3-mannosyl-glycoprotein 4-beta-N-acetylglucosaminyltransferase A n=1 Tax=Albula glossodonta TaxID=121402 RepID=A0A8T2NGC9_9TELE|nr:hypothetical protein JZ751_023572 [Albula glossodonta]
MGIPTVKRKVKSYLAETLHSLIDKLTPEEKLDCVIIVFIGELREARKSSSAITPSSTPHFSRCSARRHNHTTHPPPPSSPLCKTDTDYVNSVVEGLEKELSLSFFSRCLNVFDVSCNRQLWVAHDFGGGLRIEVMLTMETLTSPPPATLFRRRFSTEFSSGLLEVISPPASYYPDFNNLKETFGDSKERVRWRTKQNLDYSFLMMYAVSKGVYYVQLEDDIVAKPNYFATMKNFALQLSSEEWMILEFSQLGFIGKMFQAPDLNLIVEFILMFYKEKPIDWLLDHILWVKVCNPEKDAKHCERQKSGLRVRFRPSLFQHVGLHSSLAGKIQKLTDKDFLKPLLHKIHEHPGDKLENTTVEVLPFSDTGLQTKDKYKRTDDRYYKIGRFEKGVAEGVLDPVFNPVVALRLTVLQDSAVSTSRKWQSNRLSWGSATGPSPLPTPNSAPFDARAPLMTAVHRASSP